jgi:preprotein translocase subunit SecB
MLSPLRLNKIYIEKLLVRSCDEAPLIAARQDYRMVLSHRNLLPSSGEDDFLEKWLELRVRLTPSEPKNPVCAFKDIDIVVKGRFNFPAGISEKNRELLYPVNAVAILFGFIRGIVAQCTGMFANGSFLLPPIDVTKARKSNRLVIDCSLTSDIQIEQVAAIQEKEALPKPKVK